MEKKKKYKTRQRDIILNCLKENKSEHMTVDHMIRMLRNREERVGRTTVYRNLELLVEEGEAFKFTVPGGTNTCYQFADGGCHSAGHHHAVCSSCGKMLHVDCDFLDDLYRHMEGEHAFRIDPFKTVFYGCCDRCDEKS